MYLFNTKIKALSMPTMVEILKASLSDELHKSASLGKLYKKKLLY